MTAARGRLELSGGGCAAQERPAPRGKINSSIGRQGVSLFRRYLIVILTGMRFK